MSACSVETVEQLTQVLLEQGKGTRVRIERGMRDYVAPALLAKANQLAQAGLPVAIVCADGVAYERYCAHLPSYSSLSAASVVKMRDFALSYIENPRVSAFIGRKARVLDDNEYDVLLEDMKVSALKPRRLREMLKFFYRSMSDCTNEIPRWLVNSEEQTVYAILTENLETREALLSHEVSAAAYRGLVGANIECPSLCVLVDDFGTLSKASQRLLKHVATESLVVAGATGSTANTEEPYPFHEGFMSLDGSFSTIALVSNLPQAKTRLEACADPTEEFAFTADTVLQRLAEGVSPHDILVAVPNKTWAAQLAAELSKREVRTHLCLGSSKVKGDPRDVSRGGDLKLAAFLRLLLNPEDFTALRSWLGIGDWLLRSDAFLELMAFAREHNLNVREAMKQLRTMPDTQRSSKIFGKFDAPLDELEQLNAACVNISCAEAVSLFERHGMPLDQRKVQLLGNDPQRANLQQLAREAFAPSGEVASQDAVIIALYEQCHGRVVHTLFATGLINGFLPKADAVDDKHTIDHRRSALERDRALFSDVSSIATNEVVCSYFKRDRLENAGLLDMQPSRVYVKDDVRYANVEPSVFIESLS